MNIIAALDFLEDLKDMFPKTFFEFCDDVTRDGGECFRIAWYDGPSEARVRAFAAGYFPSSLLLLLHRIESTCCGDAA